MKLTKMETIVLAFFIKFATKSEQSRIVRIFKCIRMRGG